MKKIYIVCAEPSGDALGVALLRQVKKMGCNIRFVGLGGCDMKGEGVRSLFPIEELSVMGITELLVHLPRLYGRLKEVVQDIKREKPDLILTIDAPSFTKRVAKCIRKIDPSIPLVHYVAPSVWAWREGRSKTYAKLFDHILCLLPFEPPYFERHGGVASFVGHPIVERIRDYMPQSPKEPILLLLLGSRVQEVKRHIEPFIQTAKTILSRHPQIRVVIPTFKHLRPFIEPHIPKNFSIDDSVDNRFEWFAKASYALCVSGTVSLELAMFGVKTVVGYCMSPFSYLLAKRLIKIPFISLVNIVGDVPYIPECVQKLCCHPNLVLHMENIISSAKTQVPGSILDHFSCENQSPSQRVLEILQKFLI